MRTLLKISYFGEAGAKVSGNPMGSEIMRNVKLIPLADNEQNHRLVQKVLEAAPKYTFNVSGEAVDVHVGAETFSALPPNLSREKKQVIGIFLEEELIGVIDLLTGFPESHIAYIGLLLVSEKFQGQGFGRKAFSQITLPSTISKIRLSVVESNSTVLNFWKKVGFVETGVKKPFENKKVRSQSILMEKSV